MVRGSKYCQSAPLAAPGWRQQLVSHTCEYKESHQFLRIALFAVSFVRWHTARCRKGAVRQGKYRLQACSSQICHKYRVHWIPSVLKAVCPTFAARRSNRPQVSPTHLLRAPLQWQFLCMS